MANKIFRFGRLMAIVLAAYSAAGCGATTEDQNPQKSALTSVEAPSSDRLAVVHLRVARAAFDQGSLQTALELFEKAHQSAPGDAAALVGKGDVLFAQRKFDAAVAAYRAATARDPNAFEAQEGLGKTLVTLKKYQEGLRSFEAARAIRTDAGLVNKIGVTYELMGEGQAAQKHYREALMLDAESLTVRNNLALSLAVSGAYEVAMSEMERVVSSPKSSERHHANLAFIYGLAGRPMDQAPAQVMQAAINKGWDEEFFLRTRKIAQTGDRTAILDLLNNGATQSAKLPKMPEMPEMPPTDANQAASAAPAYIPPPPPAPTQSTAAVAPQAAPETVIASIVPVTPDSAVSAPKNDLPSAYTVISPPLADASEPENIPVLDVPAPPPAPLEASKPENIPVLDAPAPPPAPLEASKPQTAMTAPEPVPAPTPAPVAVSEPATTPTVEPETQVATRTPEPVPAPTPVPTADSATPGGKYRLQLGAYPSRWLGRALQGLSKAVGILLPANHIEVVRGAKYHTLRSTWITDLAVARQFCITLRARGIECFVTRQTKPPVGQGFDITAASDLDALALFIASIEPITPAVALESRVAMLSPAVKPGATMAGSGKYRIQFAAYRRVEHLNRGLKVLRGKAGDLLPAVETLVRSESAEKTQIPYRLRSAPMSSRAAAVTLCESLSKKSVDCLVIRHGDQSWRSLG